MAHKTMPLAAIVAAVAGTAMILRSPMLGMDAANAWLRTSMGGSADSNTFLTMMQSYMEAYRLLGALLLGSGLFWFFRK